MCHICPSFFAGNGAFAGNFASSCNVYTLYQKRVRVFYVTGRKLRISWTLTGHRSRLFDLAISIYIFFPCVFMYTAFLRAYLPAPVHCKDT